MRSRNKTGKGGQDPPSRRDDLASIQNNSFGRGEPGLRASRDGEGGTGPPFRNPPSRRDDLASIQNNSFGRGEPGLRASRDGQGGTGPPFRNPPSRLSRGRMSSVPLPKVAGEPKPRRLHHRVIQREASLGYAL